MPLCLNPSGLYILPYFVRVAVVGRFEGLPQFLHSFISDIFKLKYLFAVFLAIKYLHCELQGKPMPNIVLNKH